MTTDDFTTAARAEAEDRWWNGAVPRDVNPNQAWILGFREGAPWARDHLAAQEPTEAEIEIVACTILAQTDGRDWDDIDEGERREYRRYALAVLIAGRSVNE